LFVDFVLAGGSGIAAAGWHSADAAPWCRDRVLILVFTCNTPVKTVVGTIFQQEAEIQQVIQIPMWT
jgi:hypothetical protein